MVELTSVRLDHVFHALSDATRRSILRKVARRERTVGELAQGYSVSLAAVSKHVKVLEHAKLITRTRRGQFQVVRLKAETMRPAETWLAYYEPFWTNRLDRLQTYLEGENDGNDDGAGSE